MNNPTAIPFLEDLGDALEHAAEQQITLAARPQRRSRWVPAVVTAALLLTAGTVLAVLLPTPPPAAAGVEIQQVGEDLVVRIVDLEAQPDQIRRAIAEAGLDVEVIPVPVSPSLVGLFVSSFVSQPGPDFEPIDVEGQTFRGFRVPADYPGRIELHIGRTARTGEDYQAGGFAYATGEPLACTGLFGVQVRDALPTLTALGLQARWQTLNETQSGMVEVPAETILDLYVTDAVSVNPNTVLIFAAPTPESMLANSMGELDTECP